MANSAKRKGDAAELEAARLHHVFPMHQFKLVNIPRADGSTYWTWGCTCRSHGAGGIYKHPFDPSIAYRRWQVHELRRSGKT